MREYSRTDPDAVIRHIERDKDKLCRVSIREDLRRIKKPDTV